MSPARDWGPRVLLLAVLLALAAWVASCTEWVETEVERPLGRPARDNPHYAAEQLLRHLGTGTKRASGLDRLPAAGATLWLTSRRWSLMPHDDERLRDWVAAGGHLVIYASARDDEEDRLTWVPVRPWGRGDDENADEAAPEADEAPEVEPVCSDDDDEPCPSEPGDVDDTGPDDIEPDAPPLGDTPPAGPLTLAPGRRAAVAATGAVRPNPGSASGASDHCEPLVEPAGIAPAYGQPRAYRACGMPSALRVPLTLEIGRALWSVGTPGRPTPTLVRVPHGRGSVTVLADWTEGLFDNRRLTAGDHGLLLVAALQARPGASVWFVREGTRVALPRWLWDEAPAVLLLGALAIALGLWRGAVRFGPPIAELLPGRRSMAEQVRGTAAFLRRTGPQALLAAQSRALDECARQHLPRWADLGRGARGELLARATGLDAEALVSALDRTLTRSPHALASTLELLETARRRLLDAARERTLAARLRAANGTPNAPSAPLHDETTRSH